MVAEVKAVSAATWWCCKPSRCRPFPHWRWWLPLLRCRKTPPEPVNPGETERRGELLCQRHLRGSIDPGESGPRRQEGQLADEAIGGRGVRCQEHARRHGQRALGP